MKIMPAGDEALVIEFGREIDEGINSMVQEMSEKIEKSRIKGVRETLPTYRSLMIFYDGQLTGFRKLSREIKKIKLSKKNSVLINKTIIEIPCCYEERFAPDMKDIEEISGLNTKEIIDLHTGKDYRIYMLGFLPGFVYLGGLDEKIAAPRLKTPRTRIPAGAVGIGGKQTGIYPVDSPGGWRLIGSTPLELYNAEREEPVLLKAGDYLRFTSISMKEYELIRTDVKNGSYRLNYITNGAGVHTA